LIEIVNASGSILFSHLLGSGSAPGAAPETQPLYLRAALLAQPRAIGSVRATLEIDDDGDIELELKARDLPVGRYDVAIGGILRGTLNIVSWRGRTKGEIEFDNEPDRNDILLDFPVLDQEITISDPSGMLFSRTLSRP
jgi:hypothetical protein